MVGQEVTRDARSHGAVFGGRGERVEVVARPPRGTGNVPTKKKLNAQKRDKKSAREFRLPFCCASRTAIYCGRTQKLKWGNGVESAISYVTVLMFLANEANVRVEQEKCEI